MCRKPDIEPFKKLVYYTSLWKHRKWRRILGQKYYIPTVWSRCTPRYFIEVWSKCTPRLHTHRQSTETGRRTDRTLVLSAFNLSLLLFVQDRRSSVRAWTPQTPSANDNPVCINKVNARSVEVMGCRVCPWSIPGACHGVRSWGVEYAPEAYLGHVMV